MNFYFYDLETSGIDPKTGRIMQFAGQMTDEDLKPVGKPLVCLVKLTEEVLPDPEAIMVHGVSPQKSIEEGYSEAEFLKLFQKSALKPDTIICGFNTIRFDDEFMRYTLYRNFHDPYEWQWQDGRSRWDVLDAARMTRALRPDGIQWPVDAKGKATNRLELLTKANGIEHEDAHDALADVIATIEVAKLIKTNQPKLFDFLVKHRTKKAVNELLSLDNPQPLVHTSGMLSSEFEKTTVVYPIAPHPNNPNCILVYDLRYDPTDFADLDVQEIRKLVFTSWKELEKQGKARLPVKGIHVNKAPAIAPMGVLDEPAQQRIGLTPEMAEENLRKLSKAKGFAARVHEAWDGQGEYPTLPDVDQQLYDGFIPDADKDKARVVRAADAARLEKFDLKFEDSRLNSMLLRYKARNFPSSMSLEEKEKWNSYVQTRLSGGVKGALGLEQFAKRLYALSQRNGSSSTNEYLIQELQLYAESLVDY